MAVRAAGNMAQASTSITQEEALEWVKNDNRRMLHVVYRVGDLERTIKYISSIHHTDHSMIGGLVGS